MTRALVLLTPVLALALLPSNVVVAALPLLRDEWTTSASAMGWVHGAYQAGYAVAVLVLLPLTDRIPAGRVIAVSALFTGLMALLFPFLAHDVPSAIVLRLLGGAGIAGIYTPGVRVVGAAATPEHRGRDVSVYVSAYYIGSTAGLWLSGALLPSIEWRGAALVLGIVALLATPLALLAAHGESAPLGHSARLDVGVLRNGPVFRTIMGYTGHCWELYTSRGWMAAFLASVLATQGVDRVQAVAEGGKWAALVAASSIVAVWAGGWVSDRCGRSRTAVVAAALSGVVTIALGWLVGAPWEVLLCVGCLHGLLLAGDASVYHTAVTELAPPAQIGSAQAWQSALGFVAATLGPAMAGLILDLGGGFAGVFVSAGLATLLGALILTPVALAEAPPARQSAAHSRS